MFPQFEEKGKVFSNVITKRPVYVHIQTSTNLIFGKVHIRPDERLKDELNSPETFLAVTDAIVHNHQGEVLMKVQFLAVNRSHIIWLLQDNEVVAQTEDK
jgi:hypothetical protein